VKRNDAAAAINAILDGEDISKEEDGLIWHDDLHDMDNTGAARDDHLRPLGASLPGTRPNTPSGGRSNIHPTTKDQEDDDLERATAASMSQGYGGQVDGKVDRNGKEQYFGPSTRKDYSESQWGVVTTAQATSEVVPDANAEHRKNVPGEPRLLKHLPDDDYLPNLLTICHGIAGVREVLLSRHRVQPTYGQDPEWWKGHAISMPRLVHTLSGRPVNSGQEDNDSFVGEVQRVMAFLDRSERSYASAVPLTQEDAIKEKNQAAGQSRTLMASFLEAWSAAGRTSEGIFCTTWGLDESSSVFEILTPAAAGEKSDLRELFDSMYWGADTDDTAKLGFDHLADVLVMHVKSPDKDAKELGITVPLELRLDRYLQENREATADVRADVASSLSKIKKIAAIEKKLTTWKHPDKDKALDPMALLKHTHGVFDKTSRLEADNYSLPNGAPTGQDVPADDADLAAQLERVIASIDSKLSLLASEREATRKTLAEMWRNPIPELDGHLKHRYLLRGVATKPNITYVLLPKEEDEDDEMIGTPMSDEGTPDGSQWWRLEYEVNTAGTGASVSKMKTPGYDVLRAVELEHGSALLVYASDAANDATDADLTLPPALAEFVDNDNALFRAELMEAATRAAPPSYDAYADENVIPSIEIERTGRNSIDSMRAERPDSAQPSPPGYGTDGFMEHHGYGLGLDIKHTPYPPMENEDDAEPVEIHLDDVEAEEGGAEMVEKAGHQPLIPGLSGDTRMQDAESQDEGVGGSSHVEDLREMR
ncbi:hypothetical protein LTR53_013685, partial [Teratosphaeriaceae sp. CCFEE 6253]